MALEHDATTRTCPTYASKSAAVLDLLRADNVAALSLCAGCPSGTVSPWKREESHRAGGRSSHHAEKNHRSLHVGICNNLYVSFYSSMGSSHACYKSR